MFGQYLWPENARTDKNNSRASAKKMNSEQLLTLLKPVTDYVASKPVTTELAAELNEKFPHQSDWYNQVKALCEAGKNDGWACQHEAGDIRYGRVFKPTSELNNYSVDIVLMKDVIGPHHSHPNGEIDLVLPLTDGAAFDGVSSGWTVYPPGSSHKPTVTNGEAYVIYLLPGGAIEFTRS